MTNANTCDILRSQKGNGKFLNKKYKGVLTMKDQTIRNINDLGKVSRIIIIIFKVFAIVGIVCFLFGGIVAAAIPGDSITFKGTSKADIIIDYDKLPKSMISVDKGSETFHPFGTDISISVTEGDETDDGTVYNMDANIKEIKYGDIKPLALLCLFGIAVFCAVILVALIFGQKLAKALSVCDSPFEENVVKAMANFGKSLIPLAVFFVIINGLSGIGTALTILIVLLFIQIFKYGAKLQKESDETL